MHTESYLNILRQSSPGAVASVETTLQKLVPEHIEPFSHQEHIKGLLLGQVQSGKTGQMLGIISAAADADEGFSIFILLTSDITALQQQTYQRALAMDTFNVCDEHDEMRFLEVGPRKPTLIVLKKNSSILRKWRNILASSGLVTGRPVFVVDDEADNASLNTMVNKREVSTINTHLKAILNLSTSSFYLQVTATPQSLLLQSDESTWRPAFVHYFPPGKGYLGGDFFYSKPKPYTNISTFDDELDILLKTDEIADGLMRSIETYLVTSSHIMLSGDSKVCNFLVHPSIRIADHEQIKAKVVKYINYIFNNLDNKEVLERLKVAWEDLQHTKPHLKNFNEIVKYLSDKPEITVYTMNSGPEGNSRLVFDNGLNVIVGGNSLGRGVTFKGLQTVYYCRSSRSPQADTFWQHCRMFGYDRDPLLMRVFMPVPLYNLFSEINASNEVLINQVEEGDFEKIQIVTTGKIKPTRTNVIDQSKYNFIVGGVNYFPPAQDEENAENLDKVLERFDDDKPMHDITIDEAKKIISKLKSDPTINWSTKAYIDALTALQAHKEMPDLVKIIVRRERNISKGTGTLLSPDDRRLGGDIKNIPVITLYRLTGSSEKGWGGNPFWIPNIKLPEGKVFHRVD
jgi:hypothetical protein